MTDRAIQEEATKTTLDKAVMQRKEEKASDKPS